MWNSFSCIIFKISQFHNFLFRPDIPLLLTLPLEYNVSINIHIHVEFILLHLHYTFYTRVVVLKGG